MNANTMTERWNEVRDDLQQRWSKLTEDDLDRLRGDLQQLVNVIEQKYGYTRETAEREVGRFVKQYDRKVQDVASKIPQQVRKQIARYPGAALATALVIMFVVGLLLRPSR